MPVPPATPLNTGPPTWHEPFNFYVNWLSLVGFGVTIWTTVWTLNVTKSVAATVSGMRERARAESEVPASLRSVIEQTDQLFDLLTKYESGNSDKKDSWREMNVCIKTVEVHVNLLHRRIPTLIHDYRKSEERKTLVGVQTQLRKRNQNAASVEDVWNLYTSLKGLAAVMESFERARAQEPVWLAKQ